MNLQDVANLTIPEGEVKMIHDKNRKLLWGRLSYDTKYKGNTTQQTYSGKNLFNKNATVTSYGNCTYTYSDGVYTVTNTNNSNPRLSLNLVLPAGTYTLNSSTYLSAATQIVDENSTLANLSNKYSGKTFTIESSSTDIRFNWASTSETIILDLNTLQIEAGAGTVTSYEPYVGGVPSPNPDYPQDINVVTGEQTIGIHGKNIFDTYSTTVYAPPSTYGDVSNNNGTITTNVNGRARIGNGFIVPVPVEPGETYCISAKLVETTSTYNIKGTFDIRTVVSGGRGTRVKLFNFYSLGTSSTKFIIPDGVTEIWVAFMSYEVDNYSVFSDVQIEKGSSATSFEPGTPHSYTVNLGSTELCKIGNYQDYIYKSGDDWYVHKEFGKIVLDGSEDWGNNSTRYFYTVVDDALIFRDSDMNSPIISNYYSVAPSAVIYSRGVSYGIALDQTVSRFRLRNSDFGNDATLLQSWLSTHNTTVYYALSTPTNTQITDNTLIGQLNAIHQFLTRYGYNFSVDGDLPIIINQGGLT